MSKQPYFKFSFAGDYPGDESLAVKRFKLFAVLKESEERDITYELSNRYRPYLVSFSVYIYLKTCL